MDEKRCFDTTISAMCRAEAAQGFACLNLSLVLFGLCLLLHYSYHWKMCHSPISIMYDHSKMKTTKIPKYRTNTRMVEQKSKRKKKTKNKTTSNSTTNTNTIAQPIKWLSVIKWTKRLCIIYIERQSYAENFIIFFWAHCQFQKVHHRDSAQTPSNFRFCHIFQSLSISLVRFVILLILCLIFKYQTLDIWHKQRQTIKYYFVEKWYHRLLIINRFFAFCCFAILDRAFFIYRWQNERWTLNLCT